MRTRWRSTTALRPSPWPIAKSLWWPRMGAEIPRQANPKAGWRFVNRDPRLGDAHGALRGPCQTAQRGEACAVTTALALAAVRFFVLTDNQYAECRVRALRGGACVVSKDADLWWHVCEVWIGDGLGVGCAFGCSRSAVASWGPPRRGGREALPPSIAPASLVPKD